MPRFLLILEPQLPDLRKIIAAKPERASVIADKPGSKWVLRPPNTIFRIGVPQTKQACPVLM